MNRENRDRKTKKPEAPSPSVAHDRFIQSRNIKEAQQYLWEASLSHNNEDLVSLKMAVWHLEGEISNRTRIAKLKEAAQTPPEGS